MKTTMQFFLGLLLVFSFQQIQAGITPFELQIMNPKPGDPTTFKSSNYANAIFVIEAFFLGCPPCNTNAKYVDELAKKYKNKPQVIVLDVGIDTQDFQYKTWIERHNPNHLVLKDATRSVIKKLGTTLFPSTYVVNSQGNVVAKTTGVLQGGNMITITSAIDGLIKANFAMQVWENTLDLDME